MVLKKGYLIVTLGKTLHIHCSGYLGDRALGVDTIVLLGKWSLKGYSSVTLGKTLLFIFIVQVSEKTELFMSIQNLEDCPGMVIHLWHWGRESAP